MNYGMFNYYEEALDLYELILVNNYNEMSI